MVMYTLLQINIVDYMSLILSKNTIKEPTYKPYPSFEKWMVGRKLKYKGGVVTIVGTPILSYPSYFITVVTRGHYTMNLN